MSDNELIIRVSGDLKELDEAYDKAKEKTATLNEALKSIAEISAVAFAALTGEAYLSIEAFKKQEESLINLNQTLQQQGIYSKELSQTYIEQADAIEKLTGVDREQIINGQALLQSMLGQTEISNELTKAVVDLSAKKKIDLFSAFSIVGKAATENTEILKRYGLIVTDTGTRAGNLAAITKALNGEFGGSAEAQTKGLGSVKLLAVAYEDLQKAIGEKLAPAFEVAVRLVTQFFKYLEENKPLLDLIVALGEAAAVVAAIGIALGVAGTAFLAFKAALVAAKIETEAMTLATRGLVGATGIGLLVVVISLLYQNWEKIWPAMTGIFRAFVDNIVPLFQGIGNLIAGAFTLSPTLITKGLDQIKTAFQNGAKEFQEINKQTQKELTKTDTEGDEARLAQQKAAADKREAEIKRREGIITQVLIDQRKLRISKLQEDNDLVIKLEEEEIKTLQALADDKNKKDFATLEQELEKIRDRKKRAQDDQVAEQKIFNQEVLENDKYYHELTTEEQKVFLDQNGKALRQSILTEKQAKLAVAKDDAELRIKNNNQALKDQIKFGKEYAAINKLMHSEIFVGSKTAFGELAALEQSSNSTLKGIGKVAASAQVAIKTAESAMNIYAGFSTIPIIGPALGVAGAIAAIAFGAEQEAAIFAAADGGLLSGGIPGVDSIPVLAQQGELIAPARSFDEVVNSVADSRNSQRSGGEGGGGGTATVILELKGDLMNFIETKIVQRQRLGVSILPRSV